MHALEFVSILGKWSNLEFQAFVPKKVYSSGQKDGLFCIPKLLFVCQLASQPVVVAKC